MGGRVAAVRIARFKVERYRSIEKAESIDLTRLTVLVGPNNEGKSNILRALVVGLQALSTVADWTRRTRPRSGMLTQRLDQFESYDWSRDFPMRLQSVTPGAYSMFELEFELNPEEVAAFKEEVGHTLNGELKLRVLIGNGGKAQFKVVKRGPGSVGLNASIEAIARFVSSRIRVEYIPVARAFDQSEMVVRREAAAAVRLAWSTAEYQAAEATLNRIVADALQPLQDRVLEGVRKFLPDVTSVSIRSSAARRLSSPEVEISIDDGQETALSAKGDGVQSLVAISLVRTLAQQSPELTYVLAVEEPEAHLHPGAIHKLREVLDELAERDQVILTTHNSILVRRDDPRANILVYNNAAAPAKSLQEVRDSLGIRIPDNMTSADVILLVEGAHDAELLDYTLRGRSAEIARALTDGRLQVHEAGGAQNIPYQYRLHRDSVCSVHVVLDDDQQGRQARVKLDKAESVAPADVTMITVNGMNESEIEDLFAGESYAEAVENRYNVVIDAKSSHPEKRFSMRMGDHFGASGQPWTTSIESNVKTLVARAIMTNPTPPLIEERCGVIDAVVRALLRKLRIEPTEP